MKCGKRWRSFDAKSLVYPWKNDDARLDTLSETVQAIAADADRRKQTRSTTFAQIWRAAHEAAGIAAPALNIARSPQAGAISQRALVLLRRTHRRSAGLHRHGREETRVTTGADRRAGRVRVSEIAVQRNKRVLLFAAKLGYQTRSFDKAARKLGVDLTFVTDRCHQLDDPWGDRAIPVHFETPEVAAYEVLQAVRDGNTTPDGILALGIVRPSPLLMSRAVWRCHTTIPPPLKRVAANSACGKSFAKLACPRHGSAAFRCIPRPNRRSWAFRILVC